MMTGPTWMQFPEVPPPGRSEAWSELLGLRSNTKPRHAPRSLTQADSAVQCGSLLPRTHYVESWRQEPAVETKRSVWAPPTENCLQTSGSRALDSIFSEMTPCTSDGHSHGTPTSSMAALGPLFSSPSPGGSSSARFSEPLRGSFQDEARRSLGSLSPFPLHPRPQSSESNQGPGWFPPVASNTLSNETHVRQNNTGATLASERTEAVEHDEHRRAALDFVLELAGPEMNVGGGVPPPPTFKRKDECLPSSQVVDADELPIPAFAIDRDAQVSMWNKQLAELSGWEKEDIAKGSKGFASVLQPESRSLSRSKGCLEIMKSVLFGLAPPAGVPFLLRTKAQALANRGNSQGPIQEMRSPWKKSPSNLRLNVQSQTQDMSLSSGWVPVELRFSRRTDAVGATCGVMCVVVPSSSPGPEAREQLCVSCRGILGEVEVVSEALDASKRMGLLSSLAPVQTLEKQRVEREGSVAHGQEQVDSLFDQGPSSNSSSCSGSSAEYLQPPTPTSPRLTTRNEAIALDTCTQAQSIQPYGHSVVSPTREASGVPEVRALVMESKDAVRMELTQNLERCGVDVVSCSTLGEAMWRFERSLSHVAEGPKFNLIFLELEPHGEDLYLAIRDLRRLEQEFSILGHIPRLDAVLHSSTSSSESEDCSSRPGQTHPGVSKTLLAHSPPKRTEKLSRGLRVLEESVHATSLCSQKADEGAPDRATLMEEAVSTATAHEAEQPCLILAAVNLNSWDLAGLDVAMEQCVRAGGDAVIPRRMPLQQLRTAMKKLGIRSKYLTFPSRLPRALSGTLHNPFNVSL